MILTRPYIQSRDPEIFIRKYRINKLSNDEFHIEIEIFSENTVINIHKKL